MRRRRGRDRRARVGIVGHGAVDTHDRRAWPTGALRRASWWARAWAVGQRPTRRWCDSVGTKASAVGHPPSSTTAALVSRARLVTRCAPRRYAPCAGSRRTTRVRRSLVSRECHVCALCLVLVAMSHRSSEMSLTGLPEEPMILLRQHHAVAAQRRTTSSAGTMHAQLSGARVWCARSGSLQVRSVCLSCAVDAPPLLVTTSGA